MVLDVALELERVLRVTDTGERHELLRRLAGVLARGGTEGGQAAEIARRLYAEKAHLGGDAHVFVMAYVGQVAAANPAEAAGWLKSLPGDLKYAASGLVAREWAKVDLKGVEAWGDEVLDPAWRTAIIRGIAGQLETMDAATGAAWARRMSASEDAVLHAETLGRVWGRSDPEAALGWLSTLEETPGRDAGLVALAESLTERNPRQAAAWLDRFPGGDLRDRAVTTVAQRWAGTEPRAALEWLSGLNQPNVLEAALPGIAGQWFRLDAAEAAAWVRTANVPEHMRDYILRMHQPRPSPAPVEAQ